MTEVRFQSDPQRAYIWSREASCSIISSFFSKEAKIGPLLTDPGAMTEMGYHSDPLKEPIVGPVTPVRHD